MTPHLQKLIDKLQFLPGVGPKTAMRMAINMLKDRDLTNQLGLPSLKLSLQSNTVSNAATSEGPKCTICSDTSREHSTICVVETPSDLISVEELVCFRGRYFVLMGRISPIDGVGPEDIGIPDLVEQCSKTKSTKSS